MAPSGTPPPSERRDALRVVSPIGVNGRPDGRLDVGVAQPDEGPVTESDLDLVQQLQTRDPAALAALYDRYAPAVYGLMRAMLNDDRLAEEATHDVFLHLWQNPHAFILGRGPFAGWLLRVARNRAIDLLRRRREQPFGTVTSEAGQPIDPTAWLVDPDPDPADQAVTLATRREVRRALLRLDPDHRRVLELAYYNGLTQKEIAATVNRPLGTVKTQIRVAMRHLADLLRPPVPGGDEPAVQVGSEGGADPR